MSTDSGEPVASNLGHTCIWVICFFLSEVIEIKTDLSSSVTGFSGHLITLPGAKCPEGLLYETVPTLSK